MLRCGGTLVFSALSAVRCLHGSALNTMDDLNNACRCLVAAKPADRSQPLQDVLDFIEREDTNRTQATECVLENNVLSVLYDVIASDTVNDVHEKAMQLIAELTKSECARTPCVSEGIVAPLVQHLRDDNPDICIQACRALGNICFDNDDGRDRVFQKNGAQYVVALMKKATKLNDEPYPRLRLVAAGCLLNLTNTHESVQEQALAAGVLEVFQELIRHHNSDDRLLQMVIVCIDALADSDHGREAIASSSLAVDVAGLVQLKDLRDAALELLATLSESDAIKVQLAKSPLVDTLLSIFQEAAEDQTPTEKLSADLVVLLLTGDGSMEQLYSEAQGAIYRETVAWLSSPKPHLQSAGALAMGNFARNDIHCIQLVHEGVAEKLIQLLERIKDEPEEETVVGGLGRSATLQHAVLSALRNLAIPASNKPVLAQTQLVERVLPCVNNDVSPVQFKLLATFRMLVDGQEKVVQSIASNEDFLTKLAVSCTAEDHAGVKGEACRLIAWMVKYCHSTSVMETFVRCGLVQPLVKMVSSEYAVMQNEALLALTLLSSSCKEPITVDVLADSLLPSIKSLLDNNASQPEIVHNVLMLCKALADKDAYKTALITNNLSSHVEKFTNSEEKNLKSTAEALLSALKA